VTPWMSGLMGLVPVLALPCLDGPAKDEKRVKVTVVLILARDSGNEIDHQLENIAKEVRKLHPNLNLKSFKLKHWEVKSLAADEKAVFDLVDKKTATIVVKHGADGENRVGLAVIAPEQGEIVYRCACGKFLPIITRCQSKSGERLILAIRVQPCNGGK
jgi:hypothetical protein